MSASAVTVDNFDVVSTPSLGGFWKFNEGSGLTATDYSKYLNPMSRDLTTLETAWGVSGTEPWWSYYPGYFSVSTYAGLRCPSAGTLLDGGSRILVISAEFNQSLGGADIDVGMGILSVGAYYEGFIISGTGTLWGRAYRLKRPFDTTYDYSADTSALTLGSPAVAAASYIPSTSVTIYSKIPAGLSKSTTVTTVPPTVQCQQISGVSYFGIGGIGTYGIRNLQFWSFASAPPLLESTLEWMAYNPGKVPSWWEGI